MPDQPAPIATTDLSEVLHSPGNSDLVLLVLADAGAAGWAGAAAAAALGIETFLVRQRTPHDYPATDIAAWLDPIDSRIRTGRRLVLAGSGLGGAAALRAAGITGASFVLAIAPSASSPGPLPQFCDCFVLADPRGAPQAWPDAVPVPIEDLPADGAVLLDTPARLRRLLTFLRARVSRPQRAAAIRTWALRERRAGGTYLGSLAERLRRHRHHGWLARLLAHAEALGASDSRLTLARAALMHRGGDVDGAVAAIKSLPPAAQPLAAVLLAELQAESGDLAGARAAFGMAQNPPEALRLRLRSIATPLPTPPPASLESARALAAAGDQLGALHRARLTARAVAGDAATMIGLAELLGHAGEAAGSAAALRAGILLDTDGSFAARLWAAAPAPVAPAPVEAPPPPARRKAPARGKQAAP